jgi:predicted PurR-regulated permease PerM
MATIDEGSRIRLKALYIAITLMGIVMFFMILTLLSQGSSLSYLSSNTPSKYEMTNMQGQITQIQNKLQYEVPSKWEYDNLDSRVVNLQTQLNNCKCW